MTDRYGLYLAPWPDSPLWRFGCRVLGYDAETGEDLSQNVPDGVSPARLRELTQGPRHYGFHATLKAPFRLAPGVGEDQLVERLAGFCGRCRPFVLERLEVATLGAQDDGSAFIALVEPDPTLALDMLERRIVEAFEPLRAPATPEEIARRRPERLSPRQREYLSRYGQPNVFEEYRFHMTLTGRVPGREIAGLRGGLETLRAQMDAQGGLTVDHVAIFRERAGAPFRLTRRLPFAGARNQALQ